jgi:cold shock CspA family protein
MTTYDHNKRRKSCQTGYLAVNNFRERGFGIIQPDDGGSEVFCHIKSFYAFGTGINNDGVYNLEHRRRVHFRLAVDPKHDRMIAVDVTPIREIQAPDGTIIELPVRGNKAREQVEAERAANKPELAEQVEQPRSDGFGSLVAALR